MGVAPVWVRPPADTYSIAIDVTYHDGVYSAVCLDLPGVGSCGDSAAEAVENLRAAFREVILSYRESGDEIPWRVRTRRRGDRVIHVCILRDEK